MFGTPSHERAPLGLLQTYARARSSSFRASTRLIASLVLVAACGDADDGVDGGMHRMDGAVVTADGSVVHPFPDGGLTVPADASSEPGMLECGTTNDIADMPARTWCRVANSKMRSVAPTGDLLEAVRANSGPAAIMEAWGSGALDTTRNRLVVWGGGHGDYAGNEVYVFDLDTLRWSRLNDPSTDIGGVEASGYYPDGLPRARHTYNSLGYLPPPVDLFCSFGGAAHYPSGQTGTFHTDCFDFEHLSWSRRADATYGGNTIGAMSAFDPVTGHYFAHGGAMSANLAEYDPVADEWTEHVEDQSGWTPYYYTAAIDPVARRFVAIGGGNARSWDLDHPNLESVAVPRTGDGVAATAPGCPGFEYDSQAHKLVSWVGGGDVYTLDVAAGTWARVTPASGNQVVPGDATVNGTRGRFRYVASLNVYVLVSTVDSDVFLYRLVRP
jgi:hypothetical protein